ncbi:MAG: amidohydrolase [Polyangiaceae bacterium]|nr:amidohydrolase [Polyangiaceae bacterium]
MEFPGLLEQAMAISADVVAVRRHLHRFPEVGLELPETQAAVLAALAPLGLVVRKGRSLGSVIARLDGDRSGPTLLLRADMDALPMVEATGLPFASSRSRAAHMCGHDAHVAMLLGAARLLAARRAELGGSVLFVFQPGEEGHAGAAKVLEEGLLDPSFAGDVRRAFALHQMPTFPSGLVATRAGTLMAAVDGFRIVVDGRGGHASQPDVTLDPIPVACEIVQAIQTFVARRIHAFEPVVVTVARIAAGTTRNVIPDRAEIEGGYRTFTPAARRVIGEGLARISLGIAAAHGLTATAETLQSYPETTNDAAAAADVLAIAAALFGRERSLELSRPLLVSEDFSHILARVPGAMAFLGTRPPGLAAEAAEPLHSPRMLLDEGSLVVGTAMHAAVALHFLSTRIGDHEAGTGCAAPLG